MIYSLPYVFIVVLFGGLALWAQSADDGLKKQIDVICFFVLLVFFGFRGFICDDWISYYPAFQKCEWDFINFNVFEYNIEWPFEPGFTFLMCLCKSIFDNFHFLVFVCTLINTILLFNFLKDKVNNIPLAIVLYLCFGGYLMNTNIMRNAIAILIVINALKYIEQRNPIKYYALCLLALSFHLSAIFYFPLYFFFHKRCNKWLYVSVFISGNMVFLLHIPIVMKIISVFLGDVEGLIQTKIESYTESDMADASTAISIGYIERLLTGVLIFCYYDKLIEIRKSNAMYINAFICFFSFFFFLSEFQIVSQRLSNNFIFAYWILWIDLIKSFYIKNNKTLFISFISIYCILKMVGMTNMKTSEYDNILFGAKSYEERLYIHNKYSKN